MGTDVIRFKLHQSEEKYCKLSKMCTLTCLFIECFRKRCFQSSCVDCGLLLQLLLSRDEETNREGIGKETQFRFSLTKSAIRLAQKERMETQFRFSLTKSAVRLAQNQLGTQAPFKLNFHQHRGGGAEPHRAEVLLCQSLPGTVISVFPISTCVFALEGVLELVHGLS